MTQCAVRIVVLVWLPALLRPGLSIIISPLNALMRDQLHSLQEHGINSAAVLNSDADKEPIYADAKSGKLRMLFISPERMRIRKFRDELAQIVAYGSMKARAVLRDVGRVRGRYGEPTLSGMR